MTPTALAWAYAVLLLLCLAVLAPLYARLLRLLDERAPDAYASMGRPRLWDGSPRKSAALQRFIYVGSREAGIPPEVRSLARTVGWLTPVLVGSLLLVVGLWAWAIAGSLG